MVKIDFDPPETRKWKRWRADCKKATKALMDSVEKGDEPDITSLYKRKSIKEEVYFSKEGPFHGKCAYCECYIEDFQHGDMEHYRPKGAVTDENDEPILVRDEKGQPRPHPGYYWLAYDWKNLLPSCTDCNQPGVIKGKKIGKRNRFPVIGKHATTPEEVEREKPLLLNPVIDLPEEHLKVDAETGMLVHRTDRGRACIDILGLNLRNRLPERRKDVCDLVRAKVLQMVYDSHYSDETDKTLSEFKTGKREYSMAGRAALVAGMADLTKKIQKLHKYIIE